MSALFDSRRRHAGLPVRCAVPLLALALASCQAAGTLINKSNLDVQTHMSETVFLDPPPDDRKTIYVGVRNTSDHPEIDLRTPIIQKLEGRGYTVVPSAKSAQYIMQLNVLQAGPVDPRQKDAFLTSGFGSTLGALALGAGAGGLTQYATGNSDAAVGVGLGVAAASFLADQFVKDVFFTVVTDIQIAERPAKGGKVSETTQTNRGTGNSAQQNHASQGVGASEGVGNFASNTSQNSTNRSQYIQTSSDFVKYNVRSVAYANQVNLKFETAVPLIVDKLSNSVANLYE